MLKIGVGLLYFFCADDHITPSHIHASFDPAGKILKADALFQKGACMQE